MRQARLKAATDDPVGFYHCFSRVVDRRFILGDLEKERFTAFLHHYAELCDIRVLAFCVMSNHFHVLLAVPRRPDVLPSLDAILARLESVGSHEEAKSIRRQLEALRRAGNAAGEAAFLAQLHSRMWDVSQYMKELKQRFTQWYNSRNGRAGTLWEGRFKSVLVEGEGKALVTMAAYLDLNPIRAGLVQDPKDYRWCGYAEAVAGLRQAREGIQYLVRALQHGWEESQAKSLEIYRMHLYVEGDEQREAVGPDGKPTRGSFTREQGLEVLAARGRLSLAEYLRCRVRYFTDGFVFGGREFVDGVFRRERERFGERRRDGARRMRGVEDDWFAMRNLQVDVFG